MSGPRPAQPAGEADEPRALPVVRVAGPDVDALAATISYLSDLDITLAALDRLVAQLDADPSFGDTIEAVALWQLAVSHYARLFTSRVGPRLPDETVDSLDPGARESHDFFMGLRDRHLAHSVSEFEQVGIGAVLSLPGSQPSVLGVADLRMQRIFEDRLTIANLRVLAGLVRDHLLSVEEAQKQALLDRLQPLAPMLYANPPLRLSAPGSHAPPRRRHR